MPPSRAAAEIIRTITATVTARAGLLDGPGLRAVLVDMKLNTGTGQVRAIVLRPEFETERPT
jgi:hypothetical protein